MYLFKTLSEGTDNAAGDGTTTQNIVEITSTNNDFSVLVQAVVAAGPADALSGDGPFTVFAPNNAAFAKLPKATLKSLLKPKNKDKLVDILTYHVVAGAAVYSKDLKARQEVKTLQGQNLLVEFPSQEQMMADIEEAIRVGVPLWFDTSEWQHVVVDLATCVRG